VDTPRVRNPTQVDYGELPELTRTLRALGSSRRGGGALQSQFFLPLLAARRRAADARSTSACVRCFDERELRKGLDRVLDKIVAAWPDHRAPVRRALHAELSERVATYLRALSRAQEALKSADEASRLGAWRAWTRHLVEVFEAADRSWMLLQAVVAVLPAKAKL
jgi:hypothetical protein